jgi:hypothetical protein
MNNKSLPWNYQVVFNLPPQVYYTTYTLTVHNPSEEIEKKLSAMKEFTEAKSVLDKIKSI